MHVVWDGAVKTAIWDDVICIGTEDVHFIWCGVVTTVIWDDTIGSLKTAILDSTAEDSDEEIVVDGDVNFPTCDISKGTGKLVTSCATVDDIILDGLMVEHVIIDGMAVEDEILHGSADEHAAVTDG